MILLCEMSEAMMEMTLTLSCQPPMLYVEMLGRYTMTRRQGLIASILRCVYEILIE